MSDMLHFQSRLIHEIAEVSVGVFDVEGVQVEGGPSQ